MGRLGAVIPALHTTWHIPAVTDALIGRRRRCDVVMLSESKARPQTVREAPTDSLAFVYEQKEKLACLQDKLYESMFL